MFEIDPYIDAFMVDFPASHVEVFGWGGGMMPIKGIFWGGEFPC